MKQPPVIGLGIRHKRKRTNVEFSGIFPLLKPGRQPFKILLQGPFGIVSEEDGIDLHSWGGFGTLVAEDVLERFVEVQTAMARGDDVSVADMFFVVDSTRRSNRHSDPEAKTAQEEEVIGDGGVTQCSVECGDEVGVSCTGEVPMECAVDEVVGEDSILCEGGAETSSFDLSATTNSEENGVCDGSLTRADAQCRTSDRGFVESAAHEPENDISAQSSSKADDNADNSLPPNSSEERAAGDAESVCPAPVPRRLVLHPEEVLFLCLALGCASGSTSDSEDSAVAGPALLRHLTAHDRHLAARYPAYHALRARGWVVRDGLLLGADYVLYRRGPAFYHAAFAAAVQVVSATSRRPLHHLSWRRADWLFVAGLCRTAEQAGKEVLLVQVLWPDDLGSVDDLTYLQKVSVQEVHLRRWAPK